MSATRHSALLTVAVLSAAAVSCTHGYTSSKLTTFSEVPETWSEGWPTVLRWPGDTLPAGFNTSDKHASLWVRYNLYAPGSVDLVLAQESLSGTTRSDTLRFNLIAPNGRITGKGGYAMYETHSPLPGRVFGEPGWVLTAWPVGNSSGITGIGVILK